MSDNDKTDKYDVKFMDGILTGIEAVSKHFGVTERTVYRWQREGMPRLSQNRYDPLQIREWRERQRGILRPAGPGYIDPKQMTFGEVGSGAGKDYQEERLKKAKADLAEMEVRQRRSELVEQLKIDELFRARAAVVKQGLLTFSRSLPPHLIHCQTEREMEIIIAAACRELLEAFCQQLPQALGGSAVDPEQLPELAKDVHGQVSAVGDVIFST